MTTETFGRMTVTSTADGLQLGGAIDERSNLATILARAKAGVLVLDLAGVAFINSLGVRDWIHMQTAATAAGLHLEMRRMSEPLVHQLNMIVATRGSGRVASFFAPYACDACGREESILVDAIAHHDQLVAMRPPAATCPECGAHMAFNDFPERYFSFLLPPPPA